MELHIFENVFADHLGWRGCQFQMANETAHCNLPCPEDPNSTEERLNFDSIQTESHNLPVSLPDYLPQTIILFADKGHAQMSKVRKQHTSSVRQPRYRFNSCVRSVYCPQAHTILRMRSTKRRKNQTSDFGKHRERQMRLTHLRPDLDTLAQFCQ